MADDTKVDFFFYYHPNHLGSTNFVTRMLKREASPRHAMYEHVEYIPFGETWIEEREVLPFGGSKSNRYLFTSKEFDQETRLYYYGARYYDPKTSVWLSADPILTKYLPTNNPKDNARLSGMGGVFRSANLNLFAYTHQNPVKLVDPTGKTTYLAARDLHTHSGIGTHGYLIITTKDPNKFKGTAMEGQFNKYTNTSGAFKEFKKGESFYAAVLSGGPDKNIEKLKKMINPYYDVKAFKEFLAGEDTLDRSWDYDLELFKLKDKDGKSSDELDKAIIKEFDAYDEKATYDNIASSKDGYNSNSLPYTVAKRAGTKNTPTSDNITGYNPGADKEIPEKHFKRKK